MDLMTERGSRCKFPHFMLFGTRPKREDLTAEIEEGHYSSTLVHLANIANDIGRTLHFNPKTEQFVNDPDANKLLTRDYRNPYVLPEEV